MTYKVWLMLGDLEFHLGTGNDDPHQQVEVKLILYNGDQEEYV